jgi:hypothetical protein
LSSLLRGVAIYLSHALTKCEGGNEDIHHKY